MNVPVAAPPIRRLRRGGEAYDFVMNEPDVAVLLVGEGVEDCNEAACQLFARERSAIIGADPLAFAPATQKNGDRSAELARSRVAAACSGEPQCGQWRIERADGRVLDTLTRIERILVDDAPRVLLCIRDLSCLDADEGALHSAALAVASVEGDTVFRELVRHLATTLGTDVAFIALPAESDSCRLRMLAFYLDGKMVEDFEYPLAGTPCETVLGQQYRMYPSALPTKFPLDAEFRALELDCYAGYPLSDARGAALGLIAVVARKPFTHPEQVESVLRIFAARAVTEIERHRSDQALRSAEASYRAIFDAAEDAIFVHDWDTGAVVDVNPKACEVYGYTYEELRRASLAHVSSGEPPYTADEAARWIEQAKRTGNAQFEWHRRNRDGSLHWDEVRLKAAVINGKPHVLAFTREITERKRAEAALRASEERYRLLFEMESDAILLVDIESLRIVDANRAALALYGYDRGELLALTATDLSVDPELTARTIRTQSGAARVPLRYHRKKSGAAFPVEIANNTLDLAGRPTILEAIRDVTERLAQEQTRNQLEAQLRQAQKMETIGHLTGGIAHDFNNILTSILGYVALASDRPSTATDAKLERYLDQVQSAVRRARDLIQQMLTFSRGQRGDPRAVALGPLVHDAMKLLRSTLPATMELDTRIARDLPAVMLDPVHLEQVLLNLCINARDAMGGSGDISVSAQVIECHDDACMSCHQRVHGRFVQLAVKDSGPGITPEVMDRMFEPFFSTKEVGKGSGMGLATVHGIVHEYGGHICVDTAPDTGTTFRILLAPLAAEHAARNDTGDPSAVAEPNAARLRGRVLVVDDEEMVGIMMGEILESWGLAATVIRNPVEAERWFMQDPARVDLVLTDQTMPKLTGLELAQRLTLVRPDLPVLLYTGYGNNVTQEQAARSGICALIAKPVEPAALLDRLRAHLPDAQEPGA
jgi:PAS domain S-box-containing protein